MRIFKLLLITGVTGLLLCSNVCAEYDYETGVYTLDYTSDASQGMRMNVVCLKPGISPSDISIGDSDTYIEFSDMIEVEAGQKADCSFSVKNDSPEGVYNVWVYTERYTEPTKPYDSFYFLGDEGVVNMLKRFNTDGADYSSLIDEYTSPEKKVLDIVKCEHYNNNKSDVTALMKNNIPFKSVDEIEKEFNEAVIVDKVNKMTAENAASIMQEFMDKTEQTTSESYKDNSAVILSEFIAKKPQFVSVKEVTDKFAEVSVLTLVNNTIENSKMEKIVEEYSDILLIDIDKYKASNTSVVNKYLFNKNFEKVSDITDAINNGIKAAGGTSQGGFPTGGGSGSSSGGGGSYAVGGGSETIVEPSITESVFSDLEKTHWAYDAVCELKDKNIISGDGDGYFRPEDSITREEFLKILLLAFGVEIKAGSDSFSDVSEGSWYEDYVSTAYALGITKGKDNDSFGVGDKIKREEMAVFVQRMAAIKGLSLPQGGKPSFDDEEEINDYAKAAVSSLSESGIINGMGNNLFMPAQNSTRAEAAVIIQRAMKNIGGTAL